MQVGKIPLFPPRFRGLLRYCDAINLTSTSGVMSSYVLSANGLYDPDITSTGHQPAGFDQMMASYEHFCVVASNIRASFTNTSAATSSPCVALSVNASPTPVTSASQILEDGNITTQRLAPTSSFGNTQTLELGVDIAKFGGVDDLLDNPYYRGDVAANPLEQQYFILQLYNLAGVTSTCEVVFEIEYTAYFKEPRKLSPSISVPLINALKRESVEKKKSSLPESWS